MTISYAYYIYFFSLILLFLKVHDFGLLNGYV
jgi:hypothetical protein